ncbi:hypothetical protein CEXT_727461 [Caerostris extrusa]|uniref:Uncharacterized protein n=1 Tax=Caerostris extrusa TaxID=172846 RepID=A0AAV4U1B3_CAEEX|nr:hypothetical protein CEXT_727461 [Caerostris extrusa]
MISEAREFTPLFPERDLLGLCAVAALSRYFDLPAASLITELSSLCVARFLLLLGCSLNNKLQERTFFLPRGRWQDGVGGFQ